MSSEREPLLGSAESSPASASATPPAVAAAPESASRTELSGLGLYALSTLFGSGAGVLGARV